VNQLYESSFRTIWLYSIWQVYERTANDAFNLRDQ
jgi:hypothetical protein